MGRIGIAAGSIAAGVLLAPGLSTALADPLTCEAFKSRVTAAILDGGHRVAVPNTFKLGYDGGDSKRYDWSGVVGLDGSMTCGKSDAFEDFSFTASSKDNVGAVVSRFGYLSAAAICSLTNASSAQCASLALRMVQGSVRQFSAEIARGEPTPAGTANVELMPHTEAEVSVIPGSMTFTIGPGTGGTVDAVRTPLNRVPKLIVSQSSSDRNAWA